MQINKTKMTATIVLVLLMASVTLTAMPVKAQGLTLQPTGGIPLPAGVTADETYNTVAHLSFRPNPVGLGQTFLVNIWLQPPINVVRYYKEVFLVTLTKPNGTKVEVGPLSSYYGDSTAWFEWVADQAGTWTIKFDFLGNYYAAGIYTSPTSGANTTFTKSVYYKPSSDGPRELTVQEDLVVLSWPPSPLPTDYWTRPISPENREWWVIGGCYPWCGPGGGPVWDELYPNTNIYGSNYCFTPYVQAPNTAHIVWKRQGALAGIIGGQYGDQIVGSGEGSYAGTPTIIYQGRAYQSITKPFNGVTQSVWQCYDIRTGEVYWELINVTQVPTNIELTPRVPVVPGATQTTAGVAPPTLVYIGGSRLIKYNAFTGAVSGNYSISPLTTGTYYMDGYALTVQDLGAAAGAERYRLINWTTTGSATTITARIFSNITFPFSSMPVVDYEAGVVVTTEGINSVAAGVTYGQRIMAASLITGKLLMNITTDVTKGTEGFFSGSTRVADHGKFAVLLNDGHFHCWDVYSGKELWVSEQTSWPWGIWGPYSIASAYGKIIYGQYDGLAAYDWDTGKVAWHYVYVAPYPYEGPYTGPEGETVMPFRSAVKIADGKVYISNSEHSPTMPLTRGWKLHCVNATTGEGIWNITSLGAVGGIADGYLTFDSLYFGYMYVFGKGKSATTVSAPLTAITKGQSVVIQGTVLDQSPAQPGAACVSKESMATYMEYLHMQHPIDGIDHNVQMTGVPVSLTAIDSNGNYVDIGTATTSAYYGTFEMAWTPPAEGTYRIIASFAGDDSYGSSGAATAVSVGPAPEPIEFPTATEPTDYSMLLYGTLAAVIIAIVVGIAAMLLALRKR